MGKKQWPYTKQFENRILALVKRWKYRMRLCDWVIEVRFRSEQNPSNIGWTMCMNTMVDARRGRMEVYPSSRSYSSVQLENTVIHEICHLLSARYDGLFQDLGNGNNITNQERLAALETANQLYADALEQTYDIGYKKGVEHGEASEKRRKTNKPQKASKGIRKGAAEKKITTNARKKDKAK